MNARMQETAVTIPPFQLNRELDESALAEGFGKTRLARIPDILMGDGALRLYKCLATEISWNAYLIADGTLYVGSGEETETQMQMLARAQRGARKGFACIHEANRLFVEDFPEGREVVQAPDSALLVQLLEFANSETFLSFARNVSGIAGLVRADLRATRFRHGHFVLFHSMLPYSTQRGQRLAGFELNLTLEWKPEWGGLHEFKTEAMQAEACVPSFNVLDIFDARRGRWISPISPWAEGERLTISGWFYGQRNGGHAHGSR